MMSVYNKRGAGMIRGIGKIIFLLFFVISINQDEIQGQPYVDDSFFFPVEEEFPFNSKIFESNELVEVTLRFDITRFMQEKPDVEYLDAELIYFFSRKDSIKKHIRLRCRGDYRYTTCPFPPIRFNFTKSDFDDEKMLELNNLKLVTHCKPDIKYTYYVMKEYLAYKIYNLVSDYSYRARLMKVKYLDSGTNKIEMTNYAFLIEPLEMLLERTNTTEVEELDLTFDHLEEGFGEKLSMFEFMIGNSDWFLPMGKNIRFLRKKDEPGAKLIPVPYDFDYSGLVNAEYAYPRDGLDLENIRDRAYFGPCLANDDYRAVLDEFMLLRKPIIDLIKKLKSLQYEERSDVRLYIESFYFLYRKDEIIQMLKKSCIETK